MSSLPELSDVTARFVLLGDGRIGWGPGNGGTDTDLYRSGTSTLQTDGSLSVSGDLAVRGQKASLVTTVFLW